MIVPEVENPVSDMYVRPINTSRFGIISLVVYMRATVPTYR